MKTIVIAVIAVGAFVPSSASAQSQVGGCGAQVTVRMADTLSKIAERCATTERRLVELNPAIQGSGDLRVGSSILVGGGQDTQTDISAQLGAAAGHAASALGGLAREVRSSAEEILNNNPDLRNRIDQLATRFKASSAAGDAHVAVQVRPSAGSGGVSVQVSAERLPASVPVVVGAGRPASAYEILGRLETGPNGELKANLDLPNDLAGANRLVVVVAPVEGDWTVHSAPISLPGG